jgi:hypothetical protein
MRIPTVFTLRLATDNKHATGHLTAGVLSDRARDDARVREVVECSTGAY